MSIFDHIKDKLVADRKVDEAYFAAALQEFQSGHIRQGIMAKALTECRGDQNNVHAIYLRMLTAAIKDDVYIEQRVKQKRQESMERAKAKLEEMNHPTPPTTAKPGTHHEFGLSGIWATIWDVILICFAVFFVYGLIMANFS